MAGKANAFSSIGTDGPSMSAFTVFLLVLAMPLAAMVRYVGVELDNALRIAK